MSSGSQMKFFMNVLPESDKNLLQPKVKVMFKTFQITSRELLVDICVSVFECVG